MNIHAKDVDVNSHRADEKHCTSPSNGQVLEAFEQLSFRSRVRGDCSDAVDYLYRRGFIEWKSSACEHACESRGDVAQLCGSGHAALDWLRSAERSPQWEALKDLPYGI